ncbi:MAG: hypothetical protein RR998_00935 [Oscillospiraceae bacterium]
MELNSTQFCKTLNGLFLILCVPSALLLSICTVLTDCASAFSALLALVLCALWALLLFKGLPLLERVRDERRIIAVFYLLLASLMVFSLFYGKSHIPVPRGDFEAIHTGVKEAVDFGHLTDSNPYFLRYGHQRGTLFVLSLYNYALQRLGICPSVDIYANMVLVDIFIALSIALSFDIARRLAGTPRAFCFALLAFSYLPFYTTTSYYSSTIGMPFITGGVWMYVVARERKRRSLSRHLLLTACGGCLAVSTVIGGLANIVAAALVIHLFITNDIKKFAKQFAALAAGFALLFTGFQFAIRNGGIIDFADEKKELFPLGYWLMVALKDDGLYVEEDYQKMVSLPDYDSRVEYTSSEISRILNETNAGDLVRHQWVKTKISWTQWGYSGASELPLSIFSAARSVLLSLIILAGAVLSAKRRSPDELSLFLLIVFGLFLFFEFWEAKPGAMFSVMPLLCVFGALTAPARRNSVPREILNTRKLPTDHAQYAKDFSSASAS